jgi:16S rRNA processing protein RimM
LKIFLKREGSFEEHDVESLRFDRNSNFLKLKGIDTQDRADALVGREIYVPEEGFGPLEDGNYYHFQIIGSAVVTKDGESVGTVKSLIPAGKETLLVVEGGGREVLIPFTRSICLDVDTSRREIRVDLPDGLLDLNEI